MFSQFQENVEGTKHCKKQCFGHFWAPKRWYLRSFRPWRRQTLVNYGILCTFWFLFALMNAKKRLYLHVFQKIEDRDVNETLQITVF